MDLLQSEEQLLAAMHPKTRYNIKVAERHGVTVREANMSNAVALQEDITRFWNMLGQTAERDRFHTHPERYYRTMVSTLAVKGRAGCSVSLRFAELDGVAVAAGLFATFGSRVTYLHGASLASARKVMAPYALHWQVIRDAKAAGMARYDLWGVAPDDNPEHAWAGITRFKTGFGGHRISYLGTWELPDSSVWYKLYRWVRQLRG
jgi:lipid II:glycine glycyltransferase (peptidoglycan interpeptide bridge formation enzyme)